MWRKKHWMLALAACLAGCLDVGLQDEVRWLEGDSASAEGQLEESSSGVSVTAETEEGSEGFAEPRADPDDETAPLVTAPACAPREVVLDGACVALGPVSASIRLNTDESAQVLVRDEAAVCARVLSPPWSTEHEIVVSKIAEETAVAFELADASGNTSTVDFELQPAPGPAVIITEVLADPKGAEPAQEFVEIANLGSEAVDLTGWTIDDNGDDNGDELPSGAVLSPGQVALLVAPDFTPELADGLPIPEKALIFRLESSIGTSGLKNSEAETVELRDATENEVSVFPGDVSPEPGASAQRRDPYLPDGVPGAFELSEEPSPGAI